jgi:hypothetical protein
MRGLKSGFSHFSDEELMLAIRQGEKTAFNELYQRYSGKLYGYMLKLLWYNEVRAQDLLQDFIPLFDRFEWASQGLNGKNKTVHRNTIVPLDSARG